MSSDVGRGQRETLSVRENSRETTAGQAQIQGDVLGAREKDLPRRHTTMYEREGIQGLERNVADLLHRVATAADAHRHREGLLEGRHQLGRARGWDQVLDGNVRGSLDVD